MKSISETGHAKNVANFEDLISFCTAYGANYNPSKAAIALSKLNILYAEAQNAISNVTSSKNSFDNVTGIRQTKFTPLKPLATKIINALSATDALDTVVKDAKTINRKIQGARANNKKGKPTNNATNETTTNTISVSQQSYDRLIDSFSKLVDLVNAEPNYNPNETGLKTVDLSNTLLELQNSNTEVINKYTEYSNARISRNEILYNKTIGLVELALDVKKYVKSVYGATSPQYKQISSLKFTRQE